MVAATAWETRDAGVWTGLWARYDAAVASLQDDKLATLDAWYLTTLPATLRARDPQPYVTQEELVKLMQWKLQKGKWRPQLLKYVTALSAGDVKQASQRALKLLRDGEVRAATEAMSTLKGVGPATASAVLAAYDPSVPFMADEALEAVAQVIGPRKYTLPHFLSFAKELRAKAEWLNAQIATAGADSAESWTAQRVQLCLYAEAHAESTAAAKAETKVKAAPRKRKQTSQPASTSGDRKAKQGTEGEKGEKHGHGAGEERRPLRRSKRTRKDSS